MSRPVSVLDYEALARARMERTAWDYYASGAADEVTLRDNRAAFDRVALHPRVMVDVARRSTEARLLGHELSMPILVAPTAFQRLAHDEGELATARGAGAAGTVMMLSTLSTTAVEDVVAVATGPVWFQLYVYRDRGASEALVRRVEAAGCTALVLTVDAPRLGRRERDERNGFHLPTGILAANLTADLQPLEAHPDGSSLSAHFQDLLDPGLTWRDLEWLRGLTDLPVIVKGVLRADDARLAVDHGASAVAVSNHGGRQLDTAVATLDALPRVADAIAGDVPILLDGGVRRGTDVVKAIALGAAAVAIGRPVLWGLAAAGAEGVQGVLELLRDDLDLAMALCGCRTVAEIGGDLVAP